MGEDHVSHPGPQGNRPGPLTAPAAWQYRQGMSIQDPEERRPAAAPARDALGRGWILADPEATESAGATLGALVQGPLVIALHGELGAGKTGLTQGIAAALGVEGEVVSPTFALMIEHAAPLPLLHIDAWRLSPAEARAIGLDEAIEGWPGLVVVEWARKIPGLLPDSLLHIELFVEGDHRRMVAWAEGAEPVALLARLEAALG